MEVKTLKEQTRAEMLIELASKNYQHGLIENAEHFLYLVQAMYPCNKADKLLKDIQKHKATGAQQQGFSINNAHIETPMEQIKLEIEDVLMRDIEKEPEKKIKQEPADPESTHKDLGTVSKTNRERRQPTNDTNKDEAETYLDIAQKFIDSNNFERARKLLLASEKLHKTERAVEMRKQITAAKRLCSFADTEPLTEQKKIEVEKLIARALNVLSRKDYKFADFLLRLALDLLPGDTFIHNIRKQVYNDSTMARDFASQENRRHPKVAEHAAKFLDLARHAYETKDVENAITFCKLAENWHDSGESREMTIKCLKAKYCMSPCLSQHTIMKAESLYINKNYKEAALTMPRVDPRLCQLPYNTELQNLILSKIRNFPLK